MEMHPYCPPASSLETDTAGYAPLWNPQAAVWWSLFLSPVFGSILHMKNWHALGEHEKAGQAMVWSVAMAVVLIVSSLVSMQNAALGRLGNMTGLIVMVLWYIACAREQVAYVDARGAYPRRGWGAPVMAAIGAFFAFAVLVVLLFS